MNGRLHHAWPEKTKNPDPQRPLYVPSFRLSSHTYSLLSSSQLLLVKPHGSHGSRGSWQPVLPSRFPDCPVVDESAWKLRKSEPAVSLHCVRYRVTSALLERMRNGNSKSQDVMAVAWCFKHLNPVMIGVSVSVRGFEQTLATRLVATGEF